MTSPASYEDIKALQKRISVLEALVQELVMAHPKLGMNNVELVVKLEEAMETRGHNP